MKRTSSRQLSHAEHLGTPQPRIQYGWGIQVSVLQMGGGVLGLEKFTGSDHGVVGLCTPAGDPDVHVPVLADPEQAALTRQELVKQRLDILGNEWPQL